MDWIGFDNTVLFKAKLWFNTQKLMQFLVIKVYIKPINIAMNVSGMVIYTLYYYWKLTTYYCI